MLGRELCVLCWALEHAASRAEALRMANAKFTRRFRAIEAALAATGRRPKGVGEMCCIRSSRGKKKSATADAMLTAIRRACIS